MSNEAFTVHVYNYVQVLANLRFNIVQVQSKLY